MAADLGSRRTGPSPPGGDQHPPSPPRVAGSPATCWRCPGVGWTVLFFLAPLGLLVVYSFGSVNLLTFKVEFGWTLSNYSGIFQKLYLDPVLRSFVLSAAATVACLLIGFPVAFTIARARGRRQALLLLAVMIPFWTSFVVRTYGIYDVIADNGPLYHLLHAARASSTATSTCCSRRWAWASGSSTPTCR